MSLGLSKKPSNKKTILVTGASGMLGLEMLRFLNKNGLKAIGTYYTHNQLIDKNLKNLKCDVGDEKSVKNLSKKIGKIDTIFHCGSMTVIERCEKNKEKCWQSNVIGTRNMVDLARKNKSKLVYVSTGSVFSGEVGNYKENDVPKPRDFYSWSKLLGEEAVFGYEKGIVVRATPIGIHGVGRPYDNFMEFLVDAVKNNKPLNLFNDVYINAISVESLSKILVRIPKVLKRGLIHVGSKDKLSKADIGQAVIAKSPNYSGEVKLISVDSLAGNNFAVRPKEMWFNVDKALKLGLKMPNLRDEVELVLGRL